MSSPPRPPPALGGVSPPCDCAGHDDVDEMLPEPVEMHTDVEEQTADVESALANAGGGSPAPPSPPCTSSSASERPMASMELDELAAASAAALDANDALDCTEEGGGGDGDAKSDAHSSGHESSPSPAGSADGGAAGAAAAAPVAGAERRQSASNSSASNADAALEYLDMDIDPKETSAASSPTSFRFLSQMEVSNEHDAPSSSGAAVVVLPGGAERTPVLARHAVAEPEDECGPSTSAHVPDSVRRSSTDDLGTARAEKSPRCVADCELHSRPCAAQAAASSPPNDQHDDADFDPFQPLFIGGPTGRDIMHDLVLFANPVRNELEERPRKGSGRPVLLRGWSPAALDALLSADGAEDAAFGAQGASSCGPRALLNVLRLLRYDVSAMPAEKRRQFDVARPRANSAPLGDYLLSRSCAGTTHGQLMAAAARGTDGAVVGLPLPIHAADFNLIAELAAALRAGRVPVLTVNMQRLVVARDKESIRAGEVPDAWHHCIVACVNVLEELVTTVEPCRAWRPAELRAALAGDRCLLVRASDVRARRPANAADVTAALAPILRSAEAHRWLALNVPGQVREALRRPWPDSAAGAAEAGQLRPPAVTHVVVPAAYEPAVTVFGYVDGVDGGDVDSAFSPV